MDLPRRLRPCLAPLVFALAALFINDYQFGSDNHAIIIPFLKDYLNPDLYPGDYLLAERDYFYTLFWPGVAGVIKLTGWSLPRLFGILHFLSLYGLMAGIFLLARQFSGGPAGFWAMTIVLFSKPLWAGEKTLLNFLDTAGVARPLLLLAIYFFLKKQYHRSFLLQGLGFLIHPLTALYGIAVIGVNWLSCWREMGAGVALRSVALLLAVGSPVLLWRMGQAPPDLNLGAADPQWLALLHVRSAFHVFPRTWEAAVLWQSGLVVAVFLLLWRRPPRGHHRFVVRGTVAIFALWLAGFFFTEMIPLTAVVQLQLFRSIFFLYVFAAVYLGANLSAACRAEGSMGQLFFGLIAGLALLYNARAWAVALAALALLALGAAAYRRQHGRAVRDGAFATAALILAAGLGLAAALFRGGVSLENYPNEPWRDVQLWAQQHTGIRAGFIVPPLWETQGFRVFSERTIYGDWKDGTQMFFNPAFGREWFRRMQQLGYGSGRIAPGEKPARLDSLLKSGFLALREPDFTHIAAEMRQAGREALGPVYLVTFAEQRTIGFPEVYRNQRFRVFAVAGRPLPGPDISPDQ